VLPGNPPKRGGAFRVPPRFFVNRQGAKLSYLSDIAFFISGAAYAEHAPIGRSTNGEAAKVAKKRSRACVSTSRSSPLVCSIQTKSVLLLLVVPAGRRAQRGVMRARRTAHDRSPLGLPRPSRSLVQADLVPRRPNSRQS